MSAEVLQLQCVVGGVLLLCVRWHHLNEDVDVADVDEHVGLQDGLAGVHLLEHAETDLQVADEVRFVELVEPDLEVPAEVLLRLRLVPEGDHEVIHDYLLFVGGVVHEGLAVVGSAVVDEGCRAEVGETVQAGAAAVLLALGFDSARETESVDGEDQSPLERGRGNDGQVQDWRCG